MYKKTAILILRTPHSDSACIDGSFGVPTIFNGSEVDKAISLITEESATAVTNRPSAPASLYSFALLIVSSSGESSFCKKPSVLAFIKNF